MATSEPRRLWELTVELLELYRELDQALDSLIEKQSPNVDSILSQMERIKRVESELVPLRNGLEQAGFQAADEFNQSLDQTIEIIQVVMPKLARLEQLARSSAERLQPKVAMGVRARQMQNAYQSGDRLS